MLKLLFELISTIWEILMWIPMPWRMGLVCLIAFTFTYLLLRRIIPWLLKSVSKLVLLSLQGIISLFLLIECTINRQLRKLGRNPIPGSYLFGDIMEKIGGIAHRGNKKLTDLIKKRISSQKVWVFWIIFCASMPMLLWHSRPYLNGTKFSGYIDKGIVRWNSLEGWALTGSWTPQVQAYTPITPKSPSSTLYSESRNAQKQSVPNYATLEISSIPAGALITINDEAKGTGPLTYQAMPKEKLKIRYDAPGFEVLEIVQTAPGAGAMTSVEYALVPIDFPYGHWSGKISDKNIKLELQKGSAGYFYGVLIFQGGEDEAEIRITLRGRYDPVQRTLSLKDVNSEDFTGKLSVVLSDDLKTMKGEWRADIDNPTLPLEANWRGTEN